MVIISKTKSSQTSLSQFRVLEARQLQRIILQAAKMRADGSGCRFCCAYLGRVLDHARALRRVGGGKAPSALGRGFLDRLRKDWQHGA